MRQTIAATLFAALSLAAVPGRADEHPRPIDIKDIAAEHNPVPVVAVLSARICVFSVAKKLAPKDGGGDSETPERYQELITSARRALRDLGRPPMSCKAKYVRLATVCTDTLSDRVTLGCYRDHAQALRDVDEAIPLDYVAFKL